MTVWNRSRPNQTVTQLRGILERLGATPSSNDPETPDALFKQIDDRLDSLLHERDRAIKELDVVRSAFTSAPVALVVTNETGREVLRSRVATELLVGGASAVLPHKVLREVLDKASTTSETATEVVDVFGPPRRTLSIVAVPLVSRPAEGFASTNHQALVAPVVAFVEDTTQWRESEMARRDLVTNISHELRTPIGAIALLAETLSGEDDPDTMHHLADRLEFEAMRLVATLQDVLSLSRLEASGPGDRSGLELGALVRFCCARLRTSAELVGIELLVQDVQAHLQVLGDRSLLMRAIDNLLENAIKYSDKGEPVKVNAVVVSRPEGDFAEVSIQDSGIGIPVRERQRIFERFYRVDKARSRDTGGSGLGLALVRHVAVSHDGNVLVDSLEGVGSTFTLQIPLLLSGACADLETLEQNVQSTV